MAQNSGHETQMRLLLQERDDLQNKILMLSNEIERLNGLMNHVREDSEIWRRKYSELETEMHTTTSQIDYQHRQAQDQQRASAEEQIRKLRNKINDVEVKNVMFMVEIDRLHQVLMNQEQEIESWTFRHAETIKSHESEHVQLKSGFENLLRSRIVILFVKRFNTFRISRQLTSIINSASREIT